MKKNFFKSLLVVASVGLFSVGLAGCQHSIDVLKGKQESPNYLQIVSQYQAFLGKNGAQQLASQQGLNKNLQGVLSSSLIPPALWKYLEHNLITPNQLEEIWPSVIAVKELTAKYPAFSDKNIQKIIDEQRVRQKLAPIKYSPDTLAFFRLLFLQDLAQQAGLPPTELKGIYQAIRKVQSKAPSFSIGIKNQEISTLIAQGTQNGFQTPVMVPQVAQGVVLQGYSESAQALLSRVPGAQK